MNKKRIIIVAVVTTVLAIAAAIFGIDYTDKDINEISDGIETITNIIEDNLLFDINEKYDLESVLKLIREMKFIRKENTYIKKRQADIAI